MKKSLLILILMAPVLHLFSQTNNSPYSILGIGDIDNNFYNRTSAMSSTGIAYRSNRNLINNNPASFSALDNQFFAGEVGVNGKYVRYSGNRVTSDNNYSNDITFRRLAFGTKIAKYWGLAVGLSPFSSQNYEFSSPYPILGGNGETANSFSEGNGGINKVYVTNAYEFFHHLSIGVNVSYLFGSLSQKTSIQDAALRTLASTTNAININNVYVDYGLQYHTAIGKKWDIAAGTVFANKTNLSAQYKVLVLNTDSVAVKDETLKETFFTLPITYGGGIAVTRNKKYTFLADYRYQAWGDLNYSGFNYTLQNSHRWSAGFEISKKRNIYNTLFETNYFQAGAYYNESYLNVYGQQIKDYGASIGFGVNAKRSGLNWNVAFQYGQRGTTKNGLIRENYANLTFVISYRDLWYTKGRRFD